jgi:hypothetical protein
VAVRAAVIGERARRGDEQHRPRPMRRSRQPRQQGDQETKGGRRVAMRLRGNLVQSAERQAALRQMTVEPCESEGQGASRHAGAFHPGQPAAQRVHDRGAVGAVPARDENGRGRHQSTGCSTR